MYNYRNNVGIIENPGSMLAQGDFPEKLRSIKREYDTIPHEVNPEGSLEAGTAHERGLNDLPEDINMRDDFYEI